MTIELPPKEGAYKSLNTRNNTPVSLLKHCVKFLLRNVANEPCAVSVDARSLSRSLYSSPFCGSESADDIYYLQAQEFL